MICGENSGEHSKCKLQKMSSIFFQPNYTGNVILQVIVDIGAEPGDTATITITTAAMPAANRMFDIKVTQVKARLGYLLKPHHVT